MGRHILQCEIWKKRNEILHGTAHQESIKEKKRRLAEMTSQAYRKELANRTNTEIIKNEDIEKKKTKSKEMDRMQVRK